MPAPSLTYTLTNGTTADASQVMQNFNDLLNGYTDGTKDLSISALTVAGTATLNGNVALGNASGDDITHTGSLASSIPIKTNNSFDIGDSTHGLRKLYLGNGGLGITCDIVSASHATTREYSVPDCGANADFVMTAGTQTSIGGAKTWTSLNAWTATGAYTFGSDAGAALTRIVLNAASGQVRGLRISQAGTGKMDVQIDGSNQPIINTTANGLQFTNSADAQVGSWTDAGAWTIGPTASLTTGHVIQAQGAAGQQVLNIRKTSVAANTNNNFYVQFDASGPTADGYIQTNGSAVLSIVDASDIRLKKNVRDAGYGLATVLALRPVEFDWKEGPANVKGFIAQEVKEVLPESVSIVDQSEQDGFADAHYLETQTMIPVLVKAVQELSAKVDALAAAS